MSKKTYLYVLAYEEPEDPGMLSFGHCFIKAEDPDEAYTKGMTQFDPVFMRRHKIKEFRNNYVVDLDDKNQIFNGGKLCLGNDPTTPT